MACSSVHGQSDFVTAITSSAKKALTKNQADRKTAPDSATVAPFHSKTKSRTQLCGKWRTSGRDLVKHAVCGSIRTNGLTLVRDRGKGSTGLRDAGCNWHRRTAHVDKPAIVGIRIKIATVGHVEYV